MHSQGKMCVSRLTGIIIFALTCRNVTGQIVVWDDYIDICAQTMVWGARPPNSCEYTVDIIVEKRLYREEEPFWCLKINNANGIYSTVTIKFDGDHFNRITDTTANVTRHKVIDESIEKFDLLRNATNNIVISPSRPFYDLQRILSVKLDEYEMCSEGAGNDIGVYPSKPNSLLFRHLKKCNLFKSRIHRPPNRCELVGDVMFQELSFLGDQYFMCVIVDKRTNGSMNATADDILEIKFSNSNYGIQNSRTIKKLHPISDRINLKFELISSVSHRHVIAFVARRDRDSPVILSLKLNGVESCRHRIDPNTYSLQCGQQKIKHIPLITFGFQTYYGEFPWHAALYESAGDGTTKYICGGTVISQTAVVTAAHCIRNDVGVKTPNVLRVHLGKYDITSFYADTREYRIDEIIIHSDYNKVYLENDIAILKLQTLIVYSEYIQPICLTSPELDDDFKNRIGTVPGWGRNEMNQEGTILTEATMPIADAQECRRSHRNFFSTYLNELKFCAGYKNGTNVCTGDSGGGLVFQLSTGWYLKGIVSLGVSDKSADNLCDISQFVLFTDVSKYIKWINDNVL